MTVHTSILQSPILTLFVASGFFVFCTGGTNSPVDPMPDGSDLYDVPSESDVAARTSPVYVTFAGHIEDNDIYTSCPPYRDYRQRLLDFAEVIEAGGAAFNLQIDYEFFVGAQDCEDEATMANTDGMNVLDFLVSHYGFEIDAHQEGGWDWEEGSDNYADVRYLGGQVTTISETVGGVVWDYALQFPQLDAGQQGVLHPEFTWEPEILTCAVGYLHHENDFSNDDLSSGVWIPSGTDDEFAVHDASGHMVYVGSGPHGNWGNSSDCEFQNAADYVETLVDYIERGVVDGENIFTATIAIPGNIMFDETERVAELMDQLEPLVESGQVEYAHYTEVVETWRTSFNSVPNIFPFDSIDPTDHTCP